MRSEDGPPGSASGPGPARLPALNVKGGLSAHSARKVQEFLDQNFTRKIALAEMAAVCGLSSYHFVRAFSRTFRVPPHQYVLDLRLDFAERLLAESGMSAKRSSPAVEADRQKLVEPTRRRWPRVVGFSLLGLVVAGLGFAAGNYAAIANLLGSATAAQAETANPALPDTPFLEHVKQAGVQACSTIYPVLGQILTTGTKYSVKSLWNDQAVDKHGSRSESPSRREPLSTLRCIRIFEDLRVLGLKGRRP